MTRARNIRIIAALHLLTSIGTVLFWIGFYTGIVFPKEVLAPRIPHFEGYYAWETSFTVPDLIMATVMLVGGLRLWRDTSDGLGRSLLLAASGACAFLGVLDFTYGIRNGMYTLHHPFSLTVLSFGISLPLLGAISVYQLHKTPPGAGGA